MKFIVLTKSAILFFEGHWRLLDADYREKVVVRILTLLEEMDWSYVAVPLKECCDILEELEPRFDIKQQQGYSIVQGFL